MRSLILGLVVFGAMMLTALPAQAGSGSAVTTTCGPKSINHYPAPGVGTGGTFYNAGAAGSVKLLQLSQTNLDVEATTDNPGWKDTVITEHGVRVHVGFQQIGAPQNQERFWARLDPSGATIAIIVQSCT
jgi:hypothetical protein